MADIVQALAEGKHPSEKRARSGCLIRANMMCASFRLNATVERLGLESYAICQMQGKHIWLFDWCWTLVNSVNGHGHVLLLTKNTSCVFGQ